MKLIDAERKYHFAPYTTDSEVFKIELTAEEILNKYTDEGCQEAYAQPTVKPELTDEQSIAHLQSSGWMQRHDKEMYESGLKEQLADDSDSYDSLLPTVQPEPKWIPCNERLPSENGKYIVTEKRYSADDKNHDGKYDVIVEEVDWYGKWNRAKFFQVTAWMSLPKPFIGSEEK